jgi:trans-aconitate methyltransferase
MEAKLAEMLLTPEGFKPESIFEVGCGRGRLAHFFARIWPETSYTAIDVGQTQLRDAKRLRPDGVYKQADILTYVPDPVSELAAYDLVVSAEVLMHIKPNDLHLAFSKMKTLANRAKGRILVIEWVPLPHDLEKMQVAYWNFPHDYPALFKAAGSSILAEIRTDKQVIYWLKP